MEWKEKDRRSGNCRCEIFSVMKKTSPVDLRFSNFHRRKDKSLWTFLKEELESTQRRFPIRKGQDLMEIDVPEFSIQETDISFEGYILIHWIHKVRKLRFQRKLSLHFPSKGVSLSLHYRSSLWNIQEEWVYILGLLDSLLLREI